MMSSPETFQPPRSLRDAEARRLELLGKIQSIERQLAQRRVPAPRDMKISPHAYAEWRRRATTAQFHLLVEYRLLKQWIKRQHIQQRVHAAALSTPPTDDQLIHALSRLVKDAIRRSDWRPDDTGSRVLDLAQLRTRSAHGR